jgi:hypothetical protein
MEYSHIQKRIYGIRHRTKAKRKDGRNTKDHQFEHLLYKIRTDVFKKECVMVVVHDCITYKIQRHRTFTRSRGSSSSIVSDYGLDDRAIEVRSPTGAGDFSPSPCIQTGSGAHLGSYPMGTGGSFPGGKARPGRDADHSPPSSAEVKNE